MPPQKEVLEIGGREVSISNPDKVYFPKAGYTKLDLVDVLPRGRGRRAARRPAAGRWRSSGSSTAPRARPFFQKRAPDNRPDWIRDGRADVPVRPDRRRDRPRRRRPASPGSSTSAASTSTRTRSAPTTSTTPTSCGSTSTRCRASPWPQIREVALVAQRGARGRRARRLAEDVGLARDPHQRPDRARAGRTREVRRAALALARDVERRAPTIATSKWWKEERHGVFLDYNQNAKDRTVASAYSVRPLPDARVSMPLALGRGRRRRRRGLHARDGARRSTPSAATPGAGIDEAVGSLEALLELSARHEARGPGRRAVAAELRQAGRRAAARPAVAQAPRRTAEYEPGRGEAGGPPPEVAGRAGRRRRGRATERRPADRVGRHPPDADRPAQVDRSR